MKNKNLLTCMAAVLCLGTSCSQSYQFAGITRTRILVDKRYDATHDAKVEAMMAPYKAHVDSMMSPVVGQLAHDMWKQLPEGTLSNLLPDILVWGSKAYNETPDFGVYNMGGIRAMLSKGKVTKGDIVDIAPFENKICLLTLKGADVIDLFKQVASIGGAGLSHGVRLVITKDGKLKSATLNGKEINLEASYRVVTLDYLSHGMDGLVAFKKKTNVLSPQDYHSNVRFIIMDYFKDATSKGQVVDAKIEGRIVIE